MRLHLCPQRLRRFAFGGARQIRIDSGRRSRWGDAKKRFQEPLAPLDRRRPGRVGRNCQQGPLAEQPTPHVELRPQGYAAELRTVYVGDAVLPGQDSVFDIKEAYACVRTPAAGFS